MTIKVGQVWRRVGEAWSIYYKEKPVVIIQVSRIGVKYRYTDQHEQEHVDGEILSFSRFEDIFRLWKDVD